MKVIQYIAFGGPEVIKFLDTEKPEVADDEVLIKVAATSVNPAEIKFREGEMQQRMPVTLPYIPGLDVAGVVEAVGKNVSRLKPGDKVWAGTFGGTYAQYAALKEDMVSLMPDNISMNESASLLVGVVTSYSFLVENGKVKAGDRVLIQGAAGGTGAVMLQMAKSLGAYVIGTASGDGVKEGKALGADEMIDYKTQDFTQLVKDVDFVIDFAGGNSTDKSFTVLKKGGKLYSAAAQPSQELAEQYGVEAKFISSAITAQKMDYGKKLVEEGKIKPHVVKTMKLKDAAEVQELVSKGGLNGKIVLEID
ncbi:MAG TPA: NADP-dependent oxidoreductase [Chitinophagaceae bacterium]|nr:NADP-dependent oxidoreductase [Chitinophagaceae bacterium]